MTLDPDEVCPEHSADFSEKYKNRVDYSILKDGTPVIAIECKTRGTALKDERGQLRSYFNAAPTVKMGVITDGVVYEFYADSEDPNMMDQEAFLTLDFREIAKGKIEDSVEEGVKSLLNGNFNPENIGAEAKRKRIFQNFVKQIADLAEQPSERFVRMLLEGAGVSHVRTKNLTDFTELTKTAFREFVNLKILQRLDLPTKEKEPEKQIPEAGQSPIENTQKPEDCLALTPLESDVFNYVKRRLAFLVKEDRLFEELDIIDQRKYRGKFVVFYKRERLGRLFDFYEGSEKKYSFDFTQAGGKTVSTNSLTDVDKELLGAFTKRVAENGSPGKK